MGPHDATSITHLFYIKHRKSQNQGLRKCPILLHSIGAGDGAAEDHFEAEGHHDQLTALYPAFANHLLYNVPLL